MSGGSKITLEFFEYQEIRDTMAQARGFINVLSTGDNKHPMVETLRMAGDTLETARWRTEDERQERNDRSFMQQVRDRILGR